VTYSVNNMKVSTVLVIAGMIIISLYFLVEVNYYSGAVKTEKNDNNALYLLIPAIGIEQTINNKSVDYGVYHEPQSSRPGNGTVVLFGHRTLHGSPFLKLDQLKEGDNVTLVWSGVGNVEYRVTNSSIVSEDYRLSVEQGHVLFLITCYPLGSTKQRLVIKAQQEHIYPYQAPGDTPEDVQNYCALALIAGFFVGGMVVSLFYPIQEERYILTLATVALTMFLVMGYLFPTPAVGVESYISNLSNYLGV